MSKKKKSRLVSVQIHIPTRTSKLNPFFSEVVSAAASLRFPDSEQNTGRSSMTRINPKWKKTRRSTLFCTWFSALLDPNELSECACSVLATATDCGDVSVHYSDVWLHLPWGSAGFRFCGVFFPGRKLKEAWTSPCRKIFEYFIINT